MITRVHHVGVAVRSLEAGFRFWRDALGLPVVREAELPDQGVRAALLACGPAEVELLEPLGDDTGVARFLASRGEGLHHLCFRSDDVGRDLKRLGGTGVELIDLRPREGLAGMIGFVHPRACAGVLVELATPVGPDAPSPAPVGLAAVLITVDDVRGASEQYQNLFGLVFRLMSASGGVAQLALDEVIVQFSATALVHGRPGLAGLRIAAPDPGDVARRLGEQGIAVSAGPTGFVLGPDATHGVPLIVRQP